MHRLARQRDWHLSAILYIQRGLHTDTREPTWRRTELHMHELCIYTETGWKSREFGCSCNSVPWAWIKKHLCVSKWCHGNTSWYVIQASMRRVFLREEPVGKEGGPFLQTFEHLEKSIYLQNLISLCPMFSWKYLYKKHCKNICKIIVSFLLQFV